MPEAPVNPEEKKPQGAAVKKWPASVLLTLPFFFIVLPLYKASRESVNWRAAGLMILTFSSIAFALSLLTAFAFAQAASASASTPGLNLNRLNTARS